MRIFKNKWFARFAGKEGISEIALSDGELAKLVETGVYKEVQYHD